VFVGLVLGFIAPFLPGFLWAVLTGQDLNMPGLVLLLLLVVCVPAGGLLGGLWGARRRR